MSKRKILPFEFTAKGVKLSDDLAVFLEGQDVDEAEQIIALLMVVCTRSVELGIRQASVFRDMRKIWAISEEVVATVRKYNLRHDS